MTNYAKIDNWNGLTKLPFWQTEQCNRIIGTDGTAYPPDLTRSTTMHLFNPEICRSLPLVYQKDVVHDGVVGKNTATSPPFIFFFIVVGFFKDKC